MSLAFPKPVKETDELRMDFARAMVCLIMEYGEGTTAYLEHAKVCTFIERQRSEAHHVRKGSNSGMRTKPSPRFTVPLCVAGHDEYHHIGHETFSKKYGLDLFAHIRRINSEFDRAYPDHRPKAPEPRKPKIPETKFIRVDCVCGFQHDIPPSKILRVGSKLRYQCPRDNKWQPLKVCK